MGSDTYIHGAFCDNCKQVVTVHILKGTTVEEYFAESQKCSNCGCVGIRENE